MRWLYSKSTLLIVPSKGISDILVWQNIHTATKEVHLGVDTAKFCPAMDRAEAKIQLHLAPEDIVIGYHGRISHEKDLMTLLRAFMRLQSKHPTLKLLIVGDGVEGIKSLLKARQGVVLAGNQQNPEKYLQAMDLYVLPSLTETTSLSTLEAMSCALPVIATEVGFVKDYIKPGYNGLFFPKQQTYYLVAQLDKLIESVSLRKMLGNNARNTIIQQFNWDNTAKGIEEALEECHQLWLQKMKQGNHNRLLDEHFTKQAKAHAELNGKTQN
jgi:glycosyltransferase involved in cell wall biosynthesis